MGEVFSSGLSLSGGWSFTPFIAILAVVVIVTLLIVAAGVGFGRRRGLGGGSAAYFLYGLSLVSLSIVVVSAGVTVHAVSELVGPTPQDSSLLSFLCQSGLSSDFDTSPSSSSASPTVAVPSGEVLSGPSALGACGDSSSGFYSAGPGVQTSPLLPLGLVDSTNHYISVAVAAALFGLVALGGFAMAWPRARRLAKLSEPGERPLGQLPLSYAYLVAGLSGLSLLVFVPIAADSVFRAIAPEINQTYGHADGLRDVVTYLTLSLIAGLILMYHLRFARTMTEPQGQIAPAGDEASAAGAADRASEERE